MGGRKGEMDRQLLKAEYRKEDTFLPTFPLSRGCKYAIHGVF
jgi:hypothetical protein